MTHVCRIIDPPGTPAGLLSGLYVLDYDPTRMPARERDVPADALSGEHCRMIVTPHREQAAAMRPSEWIALAMTPCRCGAVMPSGNVCRPLTGYSLAIEPLDR